MLQMPVIDYSDADAECARRLLAALYTNTPPEHEETRTAADKTRAIQKGSL